jgi:alkylation response protein AidB-like acyl-CoA dehydrogenase
MFDFMLTEQEIGVVRESIDFVKSLPKQLMRDMDEEKIEYPKEFVQEAGRRNLLGLRFPKEYGGRGMGWSCEVAALEEVGVLGMALGCAYSMPSIVGEALNKFGTEEQKRKYLGPMLKGELISAEALTEPRGGSDFFGATTTAEKKGGVYVLNGQKRFIVGAKGADFFVVYVRTNMDPKAPGHESISLILVERGMGVEVQDVYGLMGTRGGGTGRLVFNNVEVPVENLIGPEHGGAMIFNSMMVPERMTSAAGAVGAGRAATEVAARYADRRHAFGAKIRKFQAVSFRIADSVARTDAARALVYAAARRLDAGLDGRRMVSEAKKLATTYAWETINDAMQVMGGIGYTNVYPIEKLLRDCRLSMIWTGTNEIMNLLIQHEYYKELYGDSSGRRDIEDDAVNADKTDEKVYQ